MEAAHKLPLSDDNALIKKAAKNAAEALGLSLATLGTIIGTRRENFSRASARLDPKQAELALLVVRVARDLSALSSGDRANMRHWVATHNRHLEAAPAEMMTSVEGLVRVVHYLDAMRGKL